MAKVYFHGTRQMARRLARRIAGMLVGRETDTERVARGVFLTLGFAALNSIKQDFIVKSRGGTGEDGVKWPPLTKEYLAYGRSPGEGRGSGRRFGPGEKAALKKAAGLGKQHRFGIGADRGLLTKAEKKRWESIYGSRVTRLSLSLPLEDAKTFAAKIAWAQIKREGAHTMLETFGNRKVDILRDTGVLFNSLSPGQLDGAGPDAVYSSPTSDGGSQQVFELLGNGVIVGTSVPYGIYHQEATSPNRLRPFLPTGNIPERWEQNWLDAGLVALEVGARQMFEAA